ncbi:MAG: hypothetical protein ACLT32_14195 [Ruminococcus bicirculans (ex Wegman et al. 2014)]
MKSTSAVCFTAEVYLKQLRPSADFIETCLRFAEVIFFSVSS